MGFIFSPPRTPSIPSYTPPPPISTPAPSSEEAKRAAQEEADKQRRAALSAKGPGSTILTGGLGDTSAAPVKLRTLLGEA
jgi:hypothetical protein